jgi:uncharacterized membrane protein
MDRVPQIGATRRISLQAVRSAHPIEWLAVGALIFAIAMRFAARPYAPLWLDEAGTGAIISQPDFTSFWHAIRWDVSSPLYYLIMRPWQAIFGLSDGALRAPSVVFSIAAPLAIAFIRVPGMSRADRLAWAALVALWVPGIGFAQDARCYALELMLATLQTLAFAELLRVTTLRTTAIWVAAATLTTASHYDAAFLAFAQGFVFLGLKRGAAVRQWPAVLLISPVVAMLLWQGPEMARFMVPGTTWYKLQDGLGMVADGAYMLGGVWWLIAMPILVLGAALLRRAELDGTPASVPGRLYWVAAASVVGAVALIGLAALKPMLIARYLAPFAPGVLLLVLLFLREIARRAGHLATGGLLVAATTICGMWWVNGAYHLDSVIEPLNFESASTELMKAGVRRVVFTWDNPNSRVMHPEHLASFGDFFFRRAGVPIDVIPVQLAPGDDPNAVLLDAARTSDAAILWIFDTWVTGTAAADHPPAISNIDPRWHCREMTEKTFGVVTCIPEDSLKSVGELHRTPMAAN